MRFLVLLKNRIKQREDHAHQKENSLDKTLEEQKHDSTKDESDTQIGEQGNLDPGFCVLYEILNVHSSRSLIIGNNCSLAMFFA